MKPSDITGSFSEIFETLGCQDAIEAESKQWLDKHNSNASYVFVGFFKELQQKIGQENTYESTTY